MKAVNLNKEIIEKIKKKIKKKKEVFFEIFSVAIFIFVVMLFLSNVNQNKKDIFDYEALLQDDLNNYNLEISRIKNKTEKDSFSNQLDDMKIQEDLFADDVYKEKKEGPFYKSF
ncbi:MAG: hypothetical protein KAI57_00885 [Candidatus Pacebacteria bacterium]|nr:hypothetical protein [Candidatus Paceibacterota bacterium]